MDACAWLNDEGKPSAWIIVVNILFYIQNRGKSKKNLTERRVEILLHQVELLDENRCEHAKSIYGTTMML